MNYKLAVENLLKLANIDIGGNRPQDIQVHDNRFYQRFLREGRMGLGESYMDGWWDCSALDEFFLHLFRSKHSIQRQTKTIHFLLPLLKSKLLPEGSSKRSKEIGVKHYDIGNDLYTRMLDKRMTYTCAYWKNADTLDAAQEAKLDLICQKLKLKPGMRVLDVGCGWGSFGKYAAEKYHLEVVGISVSQKQIELGRQLCAGLPVVLEYMDYRDVDKKLGKFDRVVSVGMAEHIGKQYLRTFMKKMAAVLAEDGLFLLHSNVYNDSHFFNPWLDKYIFPGAYVPSLAQFSEAMEEVFIIEHVQNIGSNYYDTLVSWYKNFEHSWNEIKDWYDERFFRMWKYYLLSCAAGYKGRYIQVQQMVLSKNGVIGGYNFEEV